MIQANELRIGNWVECTFIGKVQVNQHDIGEWPALAGSAIPLTPEILEKAGFVNTGEYFLNKNGGVEYSMVRDFVKDEYKFIQVKWMPAYGGKPYPTKESALLSENIKSLHQLQNLYFALTGEELKINLK